MWFFKQAQQVPTTPQREVTDSIEPIRQRVHQQRIEPRVEPMTERRVEPPVIERTVTRTSQRDLEDRFQSPQELQEEQALLRGRQSVEPPVIERTVTRVPHQHPQEQQTVSPSPRITESVINLIDKNGWWTDETVI